MADDRHYDVIVFGTGAGGGTLTHRLDPSGPLRPFRYYDLGTAAYLARFRAVVAVGRVHLSGLPGWLVWLFVHIAFLTDYRNRLAALLTWAVTFTRDARRERAFTTRQIGSLRELYATSAAPERPPLAS